MKLAAPIFKAAGQSRDQTHLVTRSHDAIDVTTSTNGLEKALALANALFMQLESRAHPVSIKNTTAGFIRPPLSNHCGPPIRSRGAPSALWVPHGPTVTSIHDVPIGLAVMEIRKEVLKRYVGDGKFELASNRTPVYGITWTEWKPEPSHRFKIVAYSPHFPAPWQREWIETRRNALVRDVAAIVAELEDVARTLPHADYFVRDRAPPGPSPAPTGICGA